MPKLLFVALHRPDRSPSQRFRYEQYTDFLIANGWSCDVSYLIPEKWDTAFYAPGNYLVKFAVLVRSILKRVIDLTKAGKYDVIFIQREAIMIGSVFFEKMYSRSGAKVLFDFDDAIWLPNVSEGNRKLEWMKSPGKISKIISLSDMIFAGNEFLAQYASGYNSNVKIIPTTIDTDRHCKNGVPDKSPDTPVCIGWTGSSTTITHFEKAIPVLIKLKEKYKDKVSLKVIGDENYVNELLDIKGIPWSVETEIEDLSAIDIGIMPLPDDDWAKGKCALKGLQYMALEIPSIMSPVGVNSELITDGVNGFLAATENEWLAKISTLIEDEELRKKIGKSARETVIAHYSVASQEANYLKYLNELAHH